MASISGTIGDWQLGDGQTWIALAMVAASVGLLAKRVIRLLRQRDCGGGCAGCSAKASAPGADQTFISLERFEQSTAART